MEADCIPLNDEEAAGDGGQWYPIQGYTASKGHGYLTLGSEGIIGALCLPVYVGFWGSHLTFEY